MMFQSTNLIPTITRQNPLNDLKHDLFTLPTRIGELGLAKVKGGSTWLTVLTITKHGFTLHKSAFHDALALQYGWTPSHPPSKCECGNTFNVEHAFSCANSGFPSLRHNKI